MVSGEMYRPDPDALLRQAFAEATRETRGHLRIYFGASAGVGKTYAMLENAAQQAAQGIEVVVGLVETHGRKETAALLQGLEILPRRTLMYRGRPLEEFDLDAALSQRPAVLLVDELAHTNVPGSRHPKRWQDVEELLGQGIDVHTTLNVQHLESLNDIVGSIAGIQVRETVPDRFFDAADEVVLVDLPADDLLQRLKEGKVYLPQQAERAVAQFFRKGNLIALRELALRRTADRVNDEGHLYRYESGRALTWQTRDRLLACVGPAPGSEQVLRSAGRLAASLNAEWHTVFIETPALRQAPQQVRELMHARLKLAEGMGSQTATVTGESIPAALAEYAHKHRITKIVLGRTRGGKLRWLQTDLPLRLSRLVPEIEVVLVSQETTDSQRPPAWTNMPGRTLAKWRGYATALVLCGVLSLAMYPLYDRFERTNIAMIFLLGVLIISSRFGRGPAILAACLNVLAFDVLFVPPRYTLAVENAEYLISVAVMLDTGLLIAHLNAGYKYLAHLAQQREDRAHEMYQLAKDLAGALTVDQISDFARRATEALTGHPGLTLVQDDDGHLIAPQETQEHFDSGVAQWCLERTSPAGPGTDTLPGSRWLYLPLKAPMRTRGVLAVPATAALAPELRRQLETLAALLAVALERVHFVSVAQQALLKMESERLRETMLSALSHDLRTPLTAMHGLAQTLAQHPERHSAEEREAIAAICSQSEAMVRLVTNLLALARLETGRTPLRPDWVALEEIIGSACGALGDGLHTHVLQTRIPPDFPLLYGDPVLLERVMYNLLENAVKYVPQKGRIAIEARKREGALEIEVSDNGPGIPAGQEQLIFEKFMRGRSESDTPGVGLGLAICRIIIEAHKGTICVSPRQDGGARFLILLPLVEMPELIDESQQEELT